VLVRKLDPATGDCGQSVDHFLAHYTYDALGRRVITADFAHSDNVANFIPVEYA